MNAEIAEALRLAGIQDLLAGRWQFKDGETGLAGSAEVDVLATSQSLALGSESLNSFSAISPEDKRVPDVNSIRREIQKIEPEHMALIMLCGGLGTRGSGMVHPLALVKNPVSGHARRLVELQLDRIRHSPMAGSPLLLFASPLNAPDLRKWIQERIPNDPVRIYTGGLIPRFAPWQLPDGFSIPYRDAKGRESYNPTGHMDAIRWFVVNGLLAKLANVKVLVTTSYSNWGTSLYDETMLSMAGYANQLTDLGTGGFMVAEVTAASNKKRTGSLLVERRDHPDEMRLVKYGYGSGEPHLPPGSSVLMSNNILYFRVEELLNNMEKATAELEIDLAGDTMLEFLSRRENRDTVAKVFDRAFPIEPYVSLKKALDGSPVIQAERDLDQLSLVVRQQSPMRPVKVGSQRSFTIKYSSQLNNQAIVKQLFI